MSDKIHVMANSLAEGKKGEKELFRCLSQAPGVLGCADVSDVTSFQQVDVDFVLHTVEMGSLMLEVKTDSYDSSGNIFYEFLSNSEYGTLGCFEKTQADVILYYFPRSRILYLLGTFGFREWVHEHRSEFQEVRVKNLSHNGIDVYHALGCKIPRRRLCECGRFVSVLKMEGPRIGWELTTAILNIAEAEAKEFERSLTSIVEAEKIDGTRPA